MCDDGFESSTAANVDGFSTGSAVVDTFFTYDGIDVFTGPASMSPA